MVDSFVSSLFLVSKFCSWILSKNLAIWIIFCYTIAPNNLILDTLIAYYAEFAYKKA